MTDTHTTAHIPDETVQADLDRRLKAAGMYTVGEIMAGTPVDKWRVHSGMDNLQFFGEWLERKAREYKVMTAGYDIGDKDKSDDLYEWSLAHSGAFHDVLVNFRAAIRALSPAEPAQGGQWRNMKDAPKGYPTEDAGCRGVSDWFLGRPSKKYRDAGAAPMVVIRRRAWPQEDGWMDNGETYYVPTYFEGWMPLPPAPNTEAGK